MSYRRKTVILILIASLVRSVVACSLELGNDEVYYRMYASHLQWNYFDHPPMVGWLIRLTAFNLLLDSEFFIRFGAILSSAGATWFIYLSGKKLLNEYTGFLAAGIYTATVYGSIIAGTFILPDSPQMVCWIGGLYLLILITSTEAIHRHNREQVLLFGGVAGIGMLCKIHTVFLWLGFLLYILFYCRKWLKELVLYIAGFLSLILFYPVIQWNIDHHFVTFLYHGSRVNITGKGIEFFSFLSFAGGQVLYSNPVVFVLIIIAVIAAFKNRLPIAIAQKRLLLLTSLPLIFIATVISLSRQVLPHWTGPAYSSLILLTACYYSKRLVNNSKQNKLFPLPIKYAIWTLIVIIVSGVSVINFMPGTFGRKRNAEKGAGDITLDMYGWRKFSVVFDSIYRVNHPGFLKKDSTVILSNKWFPAAHIDYYLARPLHLKVFAFGALEDIHQYKWWNEEQPRLNDDPVDIYVIVPSNYFFDIQEIPALKNKMPAVVYHISQKRQGSEARVFTIYYFTRTAIIFNKAEDNSRPYSVNENNSFMIA